MTDAFPVPNPWDKDPIDFPITRDYVEENGVAYRNVCPICYCTALTTFMDRHLEWHKTMMLQDRRG